MRSLLLSLFPMEYLSSTKLENPSEKLRMNIYLLRKYSMTIRESITNLAEAMHILEQLESPEYLEANGISSEEVPELKKVAEELVAKSQDEAKPFIEYKLRNRQEAQIFVTWLDAEISRLLELKQTYTKRIASADKQIDYLLKLFKIEKMQTEINELSYRKSEAVVLTDEAVIPTEYKKEKLTISIDKTEIKKALKAGTEVPGAMIEVRQNLQIK